MFLQTNNYMAEILPIRRKTLYDISYNQSINEQTKVHVVLRIWDTSSLFCFSFVPSVTMLLYEKDVYL